MFAVISIPDFSLQSVLRHEPEVRALPVALVQDDSAKSKVWQATAAARKFGVASGMTSTQAKARCEKISFRLRSTSQEEAAQEILLECACVSAAYIESTAPGICTMDLRGLPILKAEIPETALQTWADQLRGRLEGFNMRAQIGVAHAPELALQAAQGDSAFCHVTDPREFWERLPLQSVCSSPELLEILSKWGIETVGKFLALGKNRIGERLGSVGIELFQRAKSDLVRPLRLTSPRQVYEESFEFEQMVETLEPLLFIVRRLLDQLVRRLEMVSLSTAEIILNLRLESDAIHRHALKIPSPTRDPDVLFRITHNYLETLRTDSPIMAISLRVQPCDSETQQFQLFEGSVRDPNRFYETIGRLGALLGPDRVGTPMLHDSFRADDFEMVRPTAEVSSRKKRNETLVPLNSVKERPRGLPLRRFRPPLCATVRLKEGIPAFIGSGGPHGSVAKCEGPWRSSGDWWDQLWTREEWDVQMKDGGLYRIFLANNLWFVEGAYD